MAAMAGTDGRYCFGGCDWLPKELVKGVGYAQRSLLAIMVSRRIVMMQRIA